MEQAIFENFDFLVKVKVLLGQSFFFFFFFLFKFFFFAGGSDQVICPGRSNRLVGDDVISDIIALEGTCKCVAG